MESIIYVGIDVHKDTYSLCSFDMQKNLFFSQHTMKASTANVASYLKKISDKQVVLPTENILAIKEAVRLRASVLKSCKKTKQNLLSFLLYHGISYPGGGRESYWTVKFFTWLKTVTFASDYLTYCFEEYVSEVSRLIQRLDRLTAKLKELEGDKEISEGVKKLKCISGIDTVTAVSLIAETGDFNRFKSAKEFASYTGLIPGRHDSGPFGRKQRGNNEAGKSEPAASSCGVGKIDKAGDGIFARPEIKDASGKAGRNEV